MEKWAAFPIGAAPFARRRVKSSCEEMSLWEMTRLARIGVRRGISDGRESVRECVRGEIRRVLEEGVLLRVSHCFPVILWFTAAQLGVVCLWWWDLSCGRLYWCASALNARKIWGKRTLYYSTCTCRYLSMQLVYCYICCFHNALSFVSVFENLCFLFIFPFSSPLL